MEAPSAIKKDIKGGTIFKFEVKSIEWLLVILNILYYLDYFLMHSLLFISHVYGGRTRKVDG